MIKLRIETINFVLLYHFKYFNQKQYSYVYNNILNLQRLTFENYCFKFFIRTHSILQL